MILAQGRVCAAGTLSNHEVNFEEPIDAFLSNLGKTFVLIQEEGSKSHCSLLFVNVASLGFINVSWGGNIKLEIAGHWKQAASLVVTPLNGVGIPHVHPLPNIISQKTMVILLDCKTFGCRLC